MQREKFYRQCANALEKIINSKNKKNYLTKQNSSKINMIANKILKNREIYELIMAKLKFKTKNHCLSLVYIHEIMQNRFEINNYLTRAVFKLGEKLLKEVETCNLYIRINSLKDCNNIFDKLFFS
ncbi:hypothetical protein EDEG_03089 [Edhazardia aedis USNM 41457]|uniref:Uncharacterized protein n=1 Tax=Edhazardia aedis (strain USNM 41457) TaxID=1003232 RepID=J8ZS28_EDHAE|nr:hypothetical protein EDEG_03089 [Edhazardia aedis USNM 41457]|eukprot:EJW02503.1 hypothetical protein EDEG_03089 [Edhazardia aedis USNM 41457]